MLNELLKGGLTQDFFLGDLQWLNLTVHWIWHDFTVTWVHRAATLHLATPFKFGLSVVSPEGYFESRHQL